METNKLSKAIANFLVANNFVNVNCVPGYGAKQVFEEYSIINQVAPRWSFHEETAFGSSLGSAITGKRSASLFKTHGLAKAANAVIDSLTSGVNAACLIMAFDDKTGLHSDSIFDSQRFAFGFRLPVINCGKHIYEDLDKAIIISENLQLPVIVLIDTAEIDNLTYGQPIISTSSPKPYARDLFRFDLCPLIAEYQWNTVKSKISPEFAIYMEKPELPIIPEGIHEKWRSTLELYQPAMSIFSKQISNNRDNRIICGDTGLPSLFAFEPYSAVDVVTYMGGSVHLANGCRIAGFTGSWAVTGDFSFISAGHLGLVEAKVHGIKPKVLVFNNGYAAATGGQPVSSSILNDILKQNCKDCLVINQTDNLSLIEEVIDFADKSDDTKIVVLNYTKDNLEI